MGEGFPYRLLTRHTPPSDRHYWAVCLTFTGAPTANGSKFFLIFWLCVTAKPNLPVASPLQFLGRYLSRRSEVREANPLNIYCALPLFAMILQKRPTLSKIYPFDKSRVFFWKEDKRLVKSQITPPYHKGIT